MSRSPVPFLPGFSVVCALLAAATVPAACAHGTNLGDLTAGTNAGGAGGAGGSGSDRTVVTNSTGTSPNNTTSTTGGFPSANSTTSTTTGGFPAANSTTTTGGFPASTSSPSATTTTGSGTMSSACDVGGPGNTQCSNCSSCAQNSICQNQVFNCELDCDCYNIVACIQAMSCADAACVQSCENTYPFGQADFEALLQCLDCACVSTCSVPAGTCP